MRSGEIASLEWRDVDLSAGRLSVRRTLKESRTVGRAKSATSHRLIDLPRSIVAELRAHRKSKTATDPNGLVFTTAAGTALHRSNLERRHFFPALARAGVRRIRFHDLRHTCATLLLKSGVNPKVVSELMGHSSPTTTLALYGHTLPGMGREAAAQMDRLLWGDARSAPG
jgi:integrase